MPSPELAALTRAVRRGDPDAPLALADWLEEYGGDAEQGRAEHIRLDLRARSPALAGQPWAEARLEELRLSHGPAWLGKAFALRGVQRWGLERGLLWLWLRSPILKKGRLAHVAHLAAGGLLAGLRCDGWSGKELARLFESPLLAGVPGLDVLNGPVPTARLVASPHLASLERLRLANCGLDARATARLGRSSNLSALEALELPFNRVGSAGLAALARSPLMGRLTRLDMEANGVGPRGARALAATMPEGLHLKLSLNRLRCRGARHLAASPRLGRLASLDLAYNGIGPEGGAALAAAERLPPLLIDGNDLGPAHLALRNVSRRG